MKTSDEPDLDVFVLGQMYDDVRHLARMVARTLEYLIGRLLDSRDAQLKETLTSLHDHQGHPVRLAPWNWEYQYHSYLRRGARWCRDFAKDWDWWA